MDETADPANVKEDAVEFKWTPLTRDYEFEFETIRARREPTQLHPLLSKELLNKILPAKPSTSTSNASSSAALFPSPTPSPNAEKKLPSATPAAAAKKKEVFDPLRMMMTDKSSDSASAAADPLSSSASFSSSSSSSSLSIAVSPSSSASSSSSFSFPLSSPTAVSPSSSLSSSPSSSSSVIPGHSLQGWRDRRAGILSTFTTNTKIPVSANFLEEDVERGVVSVDKSQSRLEELEVAMNAQTDAKAKTMLSQQEYIQHIENQHQRLKAAWEQGERVLALKIAIQCAKLLGETATVPHFYPSMFVLLTEILDTFGELVYTRIKARGVEHYDPRTKMKTVQDLPCTFKLVDVSSTARETANNWFFKTACIRELMPRIYIDLCLLNTYRFLQPEDDFPSILQRISKTIRGVGDPLAATFARAYLCVKAADLYSSFKQDTLRSAAAIATDATVVVPKIYQTALIEAFDDFMFTFKQLTQAKFASVTLIKDQRITIDDYQTLFGPAVQFIVNNIGFKAQPDLFYALLQQYREYCTSPVILHALLSSFDPAYISENALDMVTLIKDAAELAGFSKSKLYLALGQALILSAPPVSQRLPVLNDVWKAVTKIKESAEYMEIAQVFIQYLLVNFSDREVNIFLKDVIKHVRKDNAFKTLQPQLFVVTQRVMSYSKEFVKVLSMDTFLPLFDLLDKKTKVDAAKCVLQRFAQSPFKLSDPVIIHTLFDVCKSLHDSVDSLSFDDDRRQISTLLIHFIRAIDYGRDLEQQLSIYVECRAAFTTLDAVITELVQRVLLLCMQTFRFMKGKHSKKTSGFVKACLAYCHITIPSLDEPYQRLRLLLQCGEVAMTNGMVGQGEGFFKAAVSLLVDTPATIEIYKQVYSMEEELVSYIRNLCSALLLFPGHPEHGPFYLVKGLLAAVNEYPHWKPGGTAKLRIYLGLLSLFAAYYQRRYLFHLDGLASNDDMYGGDTAFMQEVAYMIDSLISELLAQLTKIGEKQEAGSKKQLSTASLDVVNVLLSSFVMNNASATLVVKLFQLAVQNNTGGTEEKYISNTLKHIQNKKGMWYDEIRAKIATASPNAK